MDQSFESLLTRLDHLSDQFNELKDGVQKAIDIASQDPEMALTRARKVLESVVREVYRLRYNEAPGTRALENLIQRLVKDGHFPDRLDAYAAAVRKLGNVGTHTFGETITAADVYQSLTQLMPILEWYFEVEQPGERGKKPNHRLDGGPKDFTSSQQVPARSATRHGSTKRWIGAGIGLLALMATGAICLWAAFHFWPTQGGSSSSLASQGTGSPLDVSGESPASSPSQVPDSTDNSSSGTVAGTEDKPEFDLGRGAKLVLKRIPARDKTFWMGSPIDEALQEKLLKTLVKTSPDYTEAQHQVKLSHDYYLGIYHVTQAQYRALMGKQDPPSFFSKDGEDADKVKGLKTDDFPVENVSWDDARKFCEALTARFTERGYKFRLPTEAEWEFACRAGDGNKDSFPFYLKSGPSKSLSGGQVNFYGVYPFGDGKVGKYLERTSRCGDLDEFPEAVNGFGLYDMHGNIWDWCLDYYSPQYYKDCVSRVTSDPRCDKDDPKYTNGRVMRGGSWYHNGSLCRAAYREWSDAENRNAGFGFRVCCVRTR